jgi:uncharacterized membrane protein YfcA
MPLLVSGAALPTREAVPLSLLVVTLMALGNVGPYLRRGLVAPGPALILGLPALAGSWIGGSFVRAGFIPEPVQLGVFATAALVASWLLTRRRAHTSSPERPAGRAPVGLAVQGVLIGLLTGIAGVGGGFAIVPALVLLADLPMQLASGTSLLLIAVNSLVAMAAQGHWPAASLPLMLPMLVGGFVGALIGQKLAPYVADRQLRRGFAALLVASALLTGGEAWRRQHSAGMGSDRSGPAAQQAGETDHQEQPGGETQQVADGDTRHDHQPGAASGPGAELPMTGAIGARTIHARRVPGLVSDVHGPELVLRSYPGARSKGML